MWQLCDAKAFRGLAAVNEPRWRMQTSANPSLITRGFVGYVSDRCCRSAVTAAAANPWGGSRLQFKVIKRWLSATGCPAKKK